MAPEVFHPCVERQAGYHVGCEITDLAVCAVVARLCVKCTTRVNIIIKTLMQLKCLIQLL